MSKQTPENLRKAFTVVEGGLSPHHQEPEHLSEDELRATLLGQILQQYCESLANEETGFQMPDLNNISPEYVDVCLQDLINPAPQFIDFKKGPFLIDPER